ncbi:MAG: hypothetical protein KBA02_05845, partial [Paludibacteraceae bacterium]|nr:hypothetical protein [Paludibacteraceae bacterium]
MKRLFQTFFACIILLLATVQVKSQYLGGYEPSPGEQAYLDSLPGPYISFYSKNLQLPPVVDNSLKPYFRSIFSQDGGSCVQASTIGYVFTYMVNRERNISSNSNETTYPTHYTWNYCNNATNNGSGISTGWNVIKKSGIPNIASYGGLYRTFADDDANFTKRRTVWMSGYSDYRLALNNRVIESVFSIELMTSDDLDDIKHYLHDLGIGDLVKGGGLLSFGENFQNPVINDLVYPSAEAGKKVVTQWPTSGFGHAMTIVGYNDNVMWDFNGDGLYTNDGIISNWEIGAFKVANSWGAGWANDGFVYIPYRLFYSIYLSGIVIAENTVYNPKVTLRIEMDYSQRTYVNPRTGVSTDSASTTPQFIEQYETYWMPSGHIPMQGINEYPIEIELDITRKLSNIIPAKFFLDLHLVQNPGAGEVLNVSVVDYDTKDGIPVVVNCLPSFVPHTITQGFNRIPVDYDYLPSVIKQEIVVNRDLYIQKDISIADGGTLVINNSNIQLLENKSIVVNPGGTLEILNGGSVTVSGNGSIQIESHTTNPAVLVYYNGATIDLVDNNTCLDISGNLSIAANAQFTFTGAGYIKFSNPGDMYTENITCGTGASMLF